MKCLHCGEDVPGSIDLCGSCSEKLDAAKKQRADAALLVAQTMIQDLCLPVEWREEVDALFDQIRQKAGFKLADEDCGG